MPEKMPLKVERYEDTPMHWLYFDDAVFTVWLGRHRLVEYIGKPGEHNKGIRLTDGDLARAENKYDLSLNYGGEVAIETITFS